MNIAYEYFMQNNTRIAMKYYYNVYNGLSMDIVQHNTSRRLAI